LLKVGPAEMSPLVQPDGRPSLEKAIEKITEAMQGGAPVFEWMHRNAQGDDIPCEVRLVRMPSPGRNLVRASVTDITERKRAEETLRRQHAYLAALQETTLGLVGRLELTGLLETIVDRVADVMERVAAELDAVSRRIFYDPTGNNGEEKSEEQTNADFQAVLRQLGRAGDLTTKTRDTILGLDRVATYIIAAETLGVSRETRPRLKTLTRDTRSLAEHDGFLSNKINFQLDATLGMISIGQNRSITQQNNIIKIFTVAATAFLPPTLVASIYGMNFKILPELNWEYGYLWALGLMALSAVVPFLYFKRRGWL